MPLPSRTKVAAAIAAAALVGSLLSTGSAASATGSTTIADQVRRADPLPCSMTPGATLVGDDDAPVGEGPRGTGPGPAVRKPVRSDGRWFLDERGRVRVFHGTNLTRKLAPYTPSSVGFGVDDIDAMKAAGFNTIRLGFIWKALEPRPGRYDWDYLADYAGTVRQLTSRGIYVLVDSHQDMYNEQFNGEGFPDWATHADGRLVVPNCGFPLNYFFMPGHHAAWDHLWANDVRDALGRTLWNAYAQMWKVVAREFRDDRLVFGYDLINEPFPGSDYLGCVDPLIGCVQQDAELEAFQRQVARAIRQVDPHTTIYYEPWVTYDFGSHSSVGNPVGENAAFSYHAYCLLGGPGTPPIPGSEIPCDQLEDIPLAKAAQRRDAHLGAPMLSEFGAIADTALLDRVADAADAHMSSWQQWAWWNEDPSSTRPDEILVLDPAEPPRGDNLHRDRLGALTRAYPQVIAGTPTSWSYDASTRTFSLDYDTRRADGAGRFQAGATSTVFVPRRYFPRGIQIVQLGGARLEEADGQHVHLIQRRSATTVHLVLQAR